MLKNMNTIRSIHQYKYNIYQYIKNNVYDNAVNFILKYNNLNIKITVKFLK